MRLISRRRLIAVCGESIEPTAYAEDAFQIGRLIGERGAALICGGMTGVMMHAARGVKAADGLAVGLLPGDDPQAANGFIDIAIATGMGQARNHVIALSADGMIAIGGGLGTLSEIAFGLRRGKVVVGLHTWRFDREGRTEPDLFAVATPQEAVDLLFKLIG
jgi:uncharacterized protein (TIGR00725 family)